MLDALKLERGSREDDAGPGPRALTHEDDPDSSIVHILSSAQVSAPPLPRIAHVGLSYHHPHAPQHCFPEIYSLKLACCIGPSMPRASCPPRIARGRRPRRRGRMHAVTVLRQWLVEAPRGFGRMLCRDGEGVRRTLSKHDDLFAASWRARSRRRSYSASLSWWAG